MFRERGWSRVWVALLLILLGMAGGCQSTSSRRTVAAADPALGPEPGATVVEGPAPVRTVRFVDRHPLFWKPREYYETTGTNKVGKVAAATVIGIPAGVVGELRQIVVGSPPAPASVPPSRAY